MNNDRLEVFIEIKTFLGRPRDLHSQRREVDARPGDTGLALVHGSLLSSVHLLLRGPRPDLDGSCLAHHAVNRVARLEMGRTVSPACELFFQSFPLPILGVSSWFRYILGMGTYSMDFETRKLNHVGKVCELAFIDGP